MTVYIMPAGPDMFPNEYFEGEGISFRPYDGGSPNALFWNSFYEECAKRGVSVKSYFQWSRELAKSDDILLAMNHPGETLFWRIYYSIVHFKDRGGFFMKRRRFFMKNFSFFGRRVLLQVEPPVSMPFVYSHLDAIAKSGFYHRIFVIARVNHPKWEYFNYFEHRTKDITSPYFSVPKNKYLTMINSNIRPHKFTNELYGERLKAIKFFSGVEGFDFYGFGWDKPPKHPFYFHYDKYVKRVWRGKVPDKLKTMSEYKFGLAFENDITSGWVSEKIFDCMAAGTIPVYYGAPDIDKLVPKDCFIDFRKFGGYSELNAFLRNLGPEEISKFRTAISAFLKKSPTAGKFENFVNGVLK
ncbi:MAG: glycosyltransferase family 10 [Patescibacteria group bacterium]